MRTPPRPQHDHSYKPLCELSSPAQLKAVLSQARAAAQHKDKWEALGVSVDDVVAAIQDAAARDPTGELGPPPAAEGAQEAAPLPAVPRLRDPSGVLRPTDAERICQPLSEAFLRVSRIIENGGRRNHRPGMIPTVRWPGDSLDDAAWRLWLLLKAAVEPLAVGAAWRVRGAEKQARATAPRGAQLQLASAPPELLARVRREAREGARAAAVGFCKQEVEMLVAASGGEVDLSSEAEWALVLAAAADNTNNAAGGGALAKAALLLEHLARLRRAEEGWTLLAEAAARAVDDIALLLQWPMLLSADSVGVLSAVQARKAAATATGELMRGVAAAYSELYARAFVALHAQLEKTARLLLAAQPPSEAEELAATPEASGAEGSVFAEDLDEFFTRAEEEMIEISSAADSDGDSPGPSYAGVPQAEARRRERDRDRGRNRRGRRAVRPRFHRRCCCGCRGGGCF